MEEINMKIVVLSRDGAYVRNFPNVSGNKIYEAESTEVLEYRPTDSDIIGWYEVITPEGVKGYIPKDDVEIIDDVFSSTKEERKYLIHLLSYAEEELFIYSCNFLTKYGIAMEDVYDFIKDLKKKIEEVDIERS